MTTMPTTATTGTPTPRPPGGGGPTQMAPIDPIKLLKKYQWVLVGAVILGGILGLISHFVLLRMHPTFTAEVIFEITSPQEDMVTIYPEGSKSDELERFMATQKERMISTTLLESVARDPRLPFEAKNWVQPYMQGGQVNTVEAAEALEDAVSVRIITGTSYLKLVVKAQQADDVTALAKLLREAYKNELTRQTSVYVEEQRRVINETVRDLETELTSLEDQRSRLLHEESVDSLDNRTTALGQQQALTLQQLAQIGQFLTQYQGRLGEMEAMRTSEAGITYSDTQRAAANQDSLVLGQRQQLKYLETELQSMRERGFQPAHREYRRVQAQIDSTQQKLTDLIEETLARNFDAEYDEYQRQLRFYQSESSRLQLDAERLRTELSDLNRSLEELDDIDLRVNELISAIGIERTTVNGLTQRAKLRTASRVMIAQQESRPNQPSFPKLMYMVPAGVFLLTGLVGGVLFLREVLDQRVKGPSDIALLPRARVVGMVPALEEVDSRGHKVEMIFCDAPACVVSEHFRQLRTTVVKHMQRNQHRSLVILGGMPGSGASTVVTNLGLACAAMDLKVLLVDANFRRPALHKFFDLADGPGLADVLAGLTRVDDAVQHAPGVAHLDVLTVGTTEHRVYERLGGSQMGEFLASTDGKYDLVLIDVAPAMVSGDGMAVANRADASILVVRAFGEKRGMVARLRNELADCRAELFGVVINAVRSAAGGYMRQNIRASRAYHTPGMKVGESVDRDPKSN